MKMYHYIERLTVGKIIFDQSTLANSYKEGKNLLIFVTAKSRKYLRVT